MNKLLLTRLQGKTAAVRIENGRAAQIEFEAEEAAAELGNVYIGKVKNIVKNLNAAFVEYRKGVNGYYSLAENRRHLFAGETFAEGSEGGRSLREGDEILVQVSGAAVKTKGATLTANISLTGQYAVLTAGNRKLGFSREISREAWKRSVRETWEREWTAKGEDSFGLIVRTNAERVPEEMMWAEVAALAKQYGEILASTPFRTCGSLLYRPPGFAVSAVRDVHREDLEEIVTDLPELWQELDSFLAESLPEDRRKLRLYSDETISLAALYRLPSALAEASGKRVWLKSGGYLVIEPTEALTVIDVNTGKNAGKKEYEETIFQTNLEAAREIAFQLRLRNLSGIVVVDFIDMSGEAQRAELLKLLRRETSGDPVRTVIVDMTPLGLVEITRKKVKKPLHEQI